ncbi:ankyrin repeat and MYND domain-containing protein 2-like [Centruroides sculpturatus]|uniref:ankyrin repeat and MYND domain-containing protein 2-like n=1 Tax=Centruroides sculpturatus TaxID=218467 RepID=UPI000C6D783D|nr:ankyrin repeat and MYND domain-containing protein 2-like [Centruroides sculpturatus]
MSSKTQLNEKEKRIYTLIEANSVEEIKQLLNDQDIKIDCLDEQGMTPLQHAAFRGNYEMCQLLLDRGADVNANYHNSGYSTLMFASLAGKLDVVSLLLENGASTTTVNSVGRTASQMAAFVGNHDVVSIISNFIPKEQIDYYTKIHGLETEPMLPPHLVNPLYKLVIQTNIHPVRLVMYLHDNISLLEERKATRVLESLCEKEMKKTDTNELLALKFHHLSFVVRYVEKFYKEKLKEGKDSHQILERLMKIWLKGREEDGFLVQLEKFLRQCLQEFPYRECALLQQLVCTLAPVKIGDEPSAISILLNAVRGQKGCDNDSVCLTCGEPKPQRRCSACKKASYCNQTCQKLHWITHKNFCKKLAAEYEKEQKMTEEMKSVKITDNAEIKPNGDEGEKISPKVDDDNCNVTN